MFRRGKHAEIEAWVITLPKIQIRSFSGPTKTTSVPLLLFFKKKYWEIIMFQHKERKLCEFCFTYDFLLFQFQIMIH